MAVTGGLWSGPHDTREGGSAGRMMTPVRRYLPSGTVTFLFTDVEGSTKALQELGADAYAAALAEHRRIVREAFGANGGVEVDTQGDAFFVAFPTAPGALEAAAGALAGLAPGPIRVRMGIHTGTPLVSEEGYVGVDVHRAARIAGAGHGGQVLVSASTAALLGTDGLRDLGEHRLKDLSAPERIYQFGDEEYPPLRSLHRTNLPIPATTFLGRAHELAEVLALLAQDDVRLLTLIGPGGTGKTRLGLQVAAEAAERHPDGVFWVPLAPLRESELVLEVARQALGAKGGLAEHVADKSLLVLFDNFEHVIDAAGELSELLAACPNLQLLVTSRELLRIPGEQAYPVPPLEAQDGIELFLARAHATLPSFVADAAVPQLCARLEHLPLALELAAARVTVLSSTRLLERLSKRLDLLKAGRGVDPRQQTMRATIEWSYQLLNADEQQLFARLAVFAGGCTLETAEAVCEAHLDTLQSLVDKSLVRVRTRDRFWMLETIREYASERLEESAAADELGRRHAEHFLALAEEAVPNLLANPAGWPDRLEREHDNLRAAFDRLLVSSEGECALRLVGALWRFWYMRGHLAEGLRRLEGALAADERPTAARAKALNAAASMAAMVGDFTTGQLRAEEGLRLYHTLGDASGIAHSLFTLGFTAVEEGDFKRAQPLLEESVRHFRELGDEHSIEMATFNLAWAYDELGDGELARALTEDNLRRARALRDPRVEAFSLESLATYARAEGRIGDSLSMLKESLRIRRDLIDPLHIAAGLSNIADALAVEGKSGTAARLLSSSLYAFDEMGVRVPRWVAKRNEEALATIHAQLDGAAFAEAWQQGRTLTVDEAVALALDS
jgi:predicted ATPase/class 3 adenylate cyclase